MQDGVICKIAFHRLAEINKTLTQNLRDETRENLAQFYRSCPGNIRRFWDICRDLALRKIDHSLGRDFLRAAGQVPRALLDAFLEFDSGECAKL